MVRWCLRQKQLEAIRTIPKFSYKSQTIMRNSMENGFESTNLMLPRKENKNMLHSVQIFIMKFKSTYGRSFSQQDTSSAGTVKF